MDNVLELAFLPESKKAPLETIGYSVITASSAEKAVELFEKHSEIDLVLMDIDLGKGMDGTEAAGIILEYREIPILFLSSHTEPDVVEKTEKITSYGYVVKNSSITVLDASIKMAFKLFDANSKLKRELQERKEVERGLEKTRVELQIFQAKADETPVFNRCTKYEYKNFHRSVRLDETLTLRSRCNDSVFSGSKKMRSRIVQYCILVLGVAGIFSSCASTPEEAGSRSPETYWRSLDRDQLISRLDQSPPTQEELHDLLFEAVEYSEDPEIISVILDAGASAETRRAEDWTVLMEASEHNPNPEVIELLVARGAPLNAVDSRGWTALMEAVVSNPNPRIALVLVELRAEVNARDEYGWSPLLLTVQHRDDLQLVLDLLAAGADLHAMNDHRINSLMWAASHSSSPELVETLLALGADGRIRDRGGRSAYDLALANPVLRNDPVLELLKQKAERLP